MSLAAVVGLSFALASHSSTSPSSCSGSDRWVILAHGGAGAWQGPEHLLARRRQVLREAVAQGARLLADGTGALDVIETVIVRLEDAPELNAGRGGIPNREGFVELDAAIMRGHDLAAGAAAGLRTIKNPIRLARAIMEQSPHVFMVDRGAVAFALEKGIEQVNPSWFLVPRPPPPASEGKKSGTVGVTVLDRCGEIAAGTSTGGYDTKIPGRVGDVPVIGAGTYANAKTAAISATGWGEYFIRYTAAHDVSARMAYGGASLDEAMKAVLRILREPKDARGGMIGVTADGKWAAHFTSMGMLRGVATFEAPTPRVGIFADLD